MTKISHDTKSYKTTNMFDDALFRDKTNDDDDDIDDVEARVAKADELSDRVSDLLAR